MGVKSFGPLSGGATSGSNELTVEIVEPYELKPLANDSPTLASSGRGAPSAATDSTLVRIRDGQTVLVVEPHENLAPEQRYQLPASGNGELGKGGIGEVNLVFDSVLGREVAMKVLRDEFRSARDDASSNSEREVTWRFLREARVTGQLEHPNIVPLYELGRSADGSLYYTMRAVRGRTLGDAIRKAKTLVERLGLLHHFADVCQAIGYAHSRGVLHRDIKPENIMIGEYGETFVLDWGLACIQSRAESGLTGGGLSLPPGDAAWQGAPTPIVQVESHECTALGSVVGTPQYMSPEQITGTSEALDARSDVWSLGVVLFAILTGSTPFKGKTVAEILSNVLGATVTRPTEIEPLVPPELEAIALRALGRNIALRYRDAGDMAKDIVAFQSGARVDAYAYGSMELLRRFGRRHRQAVLVAGLACLVLAIMAISSYVRVRRARDNALLAEKRATAGQQLANLRYADMLLEKARNSAGTDNIVEAKFYAAEALATADRPEARGLLVGLSNAVDLQPGLSVHIPGTCNAAVAGTRESDLVCASSKGLTYFRDGKVLWFSPTNETRMITRLGNDASAILGADRRWATVANADGKWRNSGNSLLLLPTLFIGSPDDAWLATADVEGNVVVWQPEHGDQPRRLKWGQSVTALAFQKTHRGLVVGGSFGRLATWDFQNEDTAVPIGETHSTVESLAIGPRDASLVVGASDGTVSIWDLAKRRLLSTVLRHDSAVNSLVLSDSGRWLATGTRALQVDLIDMQQRSRVFSMPPARGPFVPLRFSQEDRLWLSQLGKEMIPLTVREPTPRARLLDRSNVLSLAWAPGAQFVYAGGLRESGVCVFRIADGTCVDRLPVRASHLRVIAQSPDGNFLVFAGTGKKLEVWNAKARLPLAVTDVPIDEVRTAVFDSGKPRVWVAGNAPNVIEVELNSGKVVSQFQVDGQVQSMAITPDARTFLVGLRDGRIQSRRTSGELIREVKGHSDWVTGVGFTNGSSSAISVGADGNTVFWRLPRFEILEQRREHQGRTTALAVSTDTNWVASAGEDSAIVVSETRAPWRVRLKLQGHHGIVRCLAFDSQSRWLASGGDDATVRLWNLQALDIDVDKLKAELGSTWQVELQGSKIAPRVAADAP